MSPVLCALPNIMIDVKNVFNVSYIIVINKRFFTFFILGVNVFFTFMSNILIFTPNLVIVVGISGSIHVVVVALVVASAFIH